MSMAKIIAQYSSLPSSTVRECSSPTIQGIESAILFVLAVWSGQSIAAFKKLTERLASASSPPMLLVCDIDALSSETSRRFGDLRGMGETFWIRDGQVVAALRDYTSDDWCDSVDKNNEMLRKHSS